MQLDVIENDGLNLTLEFPEMQELPDILVSGSRAFRRHKNTNQYFEKNTYALPSNVLGGIDYLVACVGLIVASEHLAILSPGGRTDTQKDALAWRFRFAAEAITLIKSQTKDQIEEYLKVSYPEGL